MENIFSRPPATDTRDVARVMARVMARVIARVITRVITQANFYDNPGYNRGYNVKRSGPLGHIAGPGQLRPVSILRSV